MSVDSIIKGESKKHERLAFMRTNPVLAIGELKSPLLFRGALPTPDGMLGALSGAIKDSGGRIERDPEDRESVWVEECLHLGVHRDTSKRTMAISGIRAWVNNAMTQRSAGQVSPTQPVLLDRLVDLSARTTSIALLDEIAIVYLEGWTGVRPDRVPLDESAIRIGSIHSLLLKALGLVGFDRKAIEDKTAVRRASRTGDVVLQDKVYQRVGLERALEILEVKPALEDDNGVLYRVGRGSRVLSYIKVQDKVVGGDGQPLVHWLGVPQYITTPREGVAWSFALGEGEYRPTAEA